jgi:hypothetical protein
MYEANLFLVDNVFKHAFRERESMFDGECKNIGLIIRMDLDMRNLEDAEDGWNPDSRLRVLHV